jgi:hypothetical protein
MKTARIVVNITHSRWVDERLNEDTCYGCAFFETKSPNYYWCNVFAKHSETCTRLDECKKAELGE